VRLGDRVGRVTNAAARRYHLSAGTEVIAGGPDFALSLLGTRTVSPGRTCDRSGSSEGINHCVDRPVAIPGFRTFPHLSAGLFNISAIIRASGLSVDWLLEIFDECRPKRAPSAFAYEATLRLASSVPPGAHGLVFLPYLLEKNRSGFFAGLSIAHGRADMARAVVESSGFAVRRHLDEIEAHGLELTGLYVSGGPAHSTNWCRMRANLTGKPLLRPVIVDSELAGCACAAYAALGVYANPVEASEAIVRTADSFEPDRSDTTQYDEAYERFSHYDDALRRVESECGMDESTGIGSF
jgi:xylulokinase